MEVRDWQSLRSQGDLALEVSLKVQLSSYLCLSHLSYAVFLAG